MGLLRRHDDHTYHLRGPLAAVAGGRPAALRIVEGGLGLSAAGDDWISGTLASWRVLPGSAQANDRQGAMAASRPPSAAVAVLSTRDLPAALARAWRLARHGAVETLDAFEDLWRTAEMKRDWSTAAQSAAAAICIIDADYRDFRSFDRWTMRLAEAVAHPGAQDDPSSSLLLLGARALCALHAAEDFDDGPDIARAVSLLRRAADADKALLGAGALITYLDNARRERDAAAIEIEAKSLVATAGPWTVGHWTSLVGQHALFNHRLDEADVDLRAALAHAGGLDLRPLTVMARLMLARLALARDDRDAATGHLALVEPIDDEREPMWSAVIQQIRSLGRLQAGRCTEALHTARLALVWAEKAAAPDAESMQMRVLEGYCLAAVGDGHGAAKAFTAAGRHGMRSQTRQVGILADMATADALAAEGISDEARPLLARAFGEVRALDYTAFYWPVPEVASRLCAQALAAGIDVEYVRGVIRTRELPPPPEAPANWPWACRVNVLGEFRVELDGRRFLAERTRSGGKPLELLRTIAGLGGRQVEVDRLVRILWPGEGRVGARSAFNVTLLRLRRQLRTEDLLVMSDSGVSLNPRLVHVDRWQLESSLATAEKAATDRMREAIDAVVDHYPGPLLPDDAAPWIEGERARLRLRIDAVLASGAARLSPLECGTVLSRILAADAALPLVAAKLREVTGTLG